MKRDFAIELEEAFGQTRERGGTVLPESPVKGWMRDRGIPVPDGAVVRTLREAKSLGRQLYKPLVAKLASDRVLHKTELGGVITGIDSEEELEEAYIELASMASEVKGYLGVLVEEQAPAGVEVIVGLQNDPHFGPVIMLGTGGIYTDLLGDVTFRMLPVTADEVEQMLSQLKGRKLLDGFRGMPRMDVSSLCQVISEIAGFACEIAPVLESADFNPVIALPDGAAVVDAKILIAPQFSPDPFSFDPPRTDYLAGFFNPQSVAVVGASAGKGKIGHVIVDSLSNYEFGGRIYPINPRHEEILGVRCYPSLGDLPETPELVVMVIDLAEGPRLLQELASMGVHNLLIVSGGGWGESAGTSRARWRTWLESWTYGCWGRTA